MGHPILAWLVKCQTLNRSSGLALKVLSSGPALDSMSPAPCPSQTWVLLTVNYELQNEATLA